MKADDDGPSVRIEPLGNRRCKGGLELLELLIDGDAEGLKDTCCGMGVVAVTSAGSQGTGDGFDQLAGRFHWVDRTPADNCAGDGPACRFFSITKKDVREVLFAKLGQQTRGRFALRRVETHVERTRGLKAETAGMIGQLVGRKPQIEQDSIDSLDSELVQDFGQLDIAGLLQNAARIGQARSRPREHQGIAIKSDDLSGRTEVFEQKAAVAAGADRSVDDDKPRL